LIGFIPFIRETMDFSPVSFHFFVSFEHAKRRIP
jgi:hypothetical protein